MSVNGWFARLNRVNAVLSGNAGIYHTACGVTTTLATVGTTPCWCGLAPVWNANDGGTLINGQRLNVAYNEYRGSDDYRWAGAVLAGQGRVDLYQNAVPLQSIQRACLPRLGANRFVYATPFQVDASGQRQLIVNGGVRASGVITNIAISPGGEVLVYQVATGTYTRAVMTEDGHDISVRNNEDPVAAFIGPDGQPWLVTVTPDYGVLVRPAFSSIGYRLTEVLNTLDARMVGAQLRIVAASEVGELRDRWIDFNASRVDLRQH